MRSPGSQPVQPYANPTRLQQIGTISTMGDIVWYIPILIFFARIADVSIGTIRMIFVIAGWRFRAAALGFVEVVIWALAIGGLVQSIANPILLLAYAGGFSAGNLVGMYIESRLALGTRVVQVINRDTSGDLPTRLREQGFRVTTVSGKGRDGPVELAYAVVKRRALPEMMALIDEMAPKAIVTIERADHASDSAFGLTGFNRRRWMMPGMSGIRK